MTKVVMGLIIWALVVLLFLLMNYTAHLLRHMEELKAIGRKIYMATRWKSTEPHRLSLHDEALLWTEFRDALVIPAGTASALGVGDPKA